MASNNHTSHPPSTPANPRPQAQMNVQQQNGTITPSSDLRMNPPAVPRSLMTPQREMRESSVVSSAGPSARKPRQNLDERDHQLMLKNVLEQRHNFKEGSKAQFWTSVNAAFQQETGKVLAQMSATVGRLVETRRRQISDWENGVIPQKPGGELNDSLDQWIAYLKAEEPEGEAERMRQVEAKRKVEEARKEARRQAIAADQHTTQQNSHGLRGEPQHGVLVLSDAQQSQQSGTETSPQPNGDSEVNGYRPHKRKRRDERSLARELASQQQTQAEADWHARRQSGPPPVQPPQSQPPQPYVQHPQSQQQQVSLAAPPPPPQYVMQYSPSEPVRRVVVEGAMTKEDWREVMGNDARLRALETKVDKIELLVSQNNKLLIQLLQSQGQQTKDRENSHHDDRHVSHEEDRVPVHLDAEFERDYL